MSENMKRLVKDAIHKLSQGSSEEFLLALNLDLELNKNNTFIELMEDDV